MDGRMCQRCEVNPAEGKTAKYCKECRKISLKEAKKRAKENLRNKRRMMQRVEYYLEYPFIEPTFRSEKSWWRRNELRQY